MFETFTKTITEPETSPLSLDEWLEETRRMLVEVYPEDVFTGQSQDPGSAALRSVRGCFDEVSQILGAARSKERT